MKMGTRPLCAFAPFNPSARCADIPGWGDRNTAAEHDASIVNHIYQSGFQQGVSRLLLTLIITLLTSLQLVQLELRRRPIGESGLSCIPN